jgi:hypothetical protein
MFTFAYNRNGCRSGGMRDERRSSLGARVSVVIKRSAWGGMRDERKSSLGARVLVVIRRSN